MGYFPVMYDVRVVIYERKMFIRLVTDENSSIQRDSREIRPFVKLKAGFQFQTVKIGDFQSFMKRDEMVMPKKCPTADAC